MLRTSNIRTTVGLAKVPTMGSIKSSSFTPLTYDAQGIMWCPEANGHHLKQLDMTAKTTKLYTCLNAENWRKFEVVRKKHLDL
ncbi:hypothetical protein GJ744_011129 [Endocarpon pusillum]|uniref:Uncharacterized protein n=1 Tax=Endocarpon pusillum TaxID=364733 RepID=A0A8H7ADI2_9EURO|nr:hypothetical protein GJ744_011129 [Endocarpon pusillum]